MNRDILSKWSVSYLSPESFEVTITFEGEDLAGIMAAGKDLLRKMARNGVRPVRTRPIPPEPHRGIQR